MLLVCRGLVILGAVPGAAVLFRVRARLSNEQLFPKHLGTQAGGRAVQRPWSGLVKGGLRLISYWI